MPSAKTDRILRLLIGFLVLALVYVAGTTLEQRIVGVGDNGKPITRSDFGGKLLVLNFWATWCPPCIQELPSLNEFQERMRAKGVVVLGISLDKNEQAYKQFLDRAKVSFVTARDPEANISSSYGTFKYPETYVIGPDGKVLEKFIGPENWMNPELLARIEKHL
jgi:cytochrome c biogenesis protein CcmG, thiol:disulfide interchange protein DsbE